MPVEIQLAEVYAAIIVFYFVFIITWFFIYVLIGAKVKGQFAVPHNSEKKYWLFFTSNFLFTITFLNPWMFLGGLQALDSVDWMTGWIFGLISCLGILLTSMIFDLSCMNYLARWKYFKWMTCKPPMSRYLWIQFVLVVTGISLGYGLARIILSIE